MGLPINFKFLMAKRNSTLSQLPPKELVSKLPIIKSDGGEVDKQLFFWPEGMVGFCLCKALERLFSDCLFLKKFSELSVYLQICSHILFTLFN